MKIVGIVGSSKATLFQCEKVIKEIILKEPIGTVFVTGDAQGVDHAVGIVVQEHNFRFTRIYSKGKGWDEGYKERNELIANYCDKIYSLALPYESKTCYHCGRDDHEKTAGCYTGKKNGNYEVMILV